MRTQNRIVVIGGTACGPKTAARARRLDPNSQITIIEQGENLSTATCGLPYYVSGVIRRRNNLLVVDDMYFRDIMNIDVLLSTRATAINRKEHTVGILDLNINQVSSIPYDKLVLATGSVPVLPAIPGIDLAGIYSLTRLQDADVLREMVLPEKTKHAVVIGAGLIGMETAEALVTRGLEVTLIEALDTVLPALLDFEIARYVEKHLQGRGVTFLSGQKVTGFEGNEKNRVCRGVTESGNLEAELVILAIGVRPNVGLARDAGTEAPLQQDADAAAVVDPTQYRFHATTSGSGVPFRNFSNFTQTSVSLRMLTTSLSRGRGLGEGWSRGLPVTSKLAPWHPQ